MIELNDVIEAAERIAPFVRRTPVGTTESLGSLARRRILLKSEHLQRTGSFKLRGAYNFVSQLPPGQPVVAASAGNHAQGVALAASLTGRQATVFMPEGASLPKVEATEAYGATVRISGYTVDDCVVESQRFAADTQASYVPPFDHPLIIAGQGTVALELLDQVDDIEVVVVPVGGGGLIAGMATAIKALRPSIRVIGVEAERAAAMRAALGAGQPTVIEMRPTMADGMSLCSVSQLTLDHARAYVDEVVTVTEEEISRAVVLLLERAKALVEPAGATGVAALLAGKVSGDGPAATVLSGGNVDPYLLINLVDHGLSATGRYLVLRIVLDDRPGELAKLTAGLAQMSLNVLDVEHHRAGLELGISEVEVRVTVETRDPDHRAQVVQGLRQQGFRVEWIR